MNKIAHLSESSLSNISSCSCEQSRDEIAMVDDFTESTEDLLLKSLSKFNFHGGQDQNQNDNDEEIDEEQFGYFLPLTSMHLTPVFLKR